MKTFCNIQIITLPFRPLDAEIMIWGLLNISLMFQTSASCFSPEKELVSFSSVSTSHYREGKQAGRHKVYNLKQFKEKVNGGVS